jgi:ankyrin repeat protein
MAINRPGSAAAFALALLASAATSLAADLRLIEAAKARRIEAVRALIRDGVDVNARFGDDSTALHWAAYWDDRETVDLLLSAGAQVNAADDHGITPLWLACANGATAATIDRLIKAGASVDVRHSSGETALMSAARTGNAAAVSRLLSAGADVGAAERNRGQTALMWAAAQGHTDIVQRLLDAGADPRARSKVRRQVVNSTGNADYTGVMEVEAGGFTALLFAARGGHVEAARRLLAAGAPVDDAGADGTSALVVAAHSGHTATALALLDAGASPNDAGSGYTALHIAVRRGDLGLVKALIARGAQPDTRLVKATPARRLSDDIALTRSLVGTTPVWLAANYGHPDIVRVLAAAGANLNAAANDGSTPLMAAIGRNEQVAAAVARQLLEAGADVNAADDSGGTALHRAASSGFNEIIKMLAGRGANLEARNRQGQTPLMLARPRRTPQGIEQNATAALLRSLGAKN